jgi:hypothetical protein
VGEEELMFKDTDVTVFVGRREDGSIYGVWSVRQWEKQEELLQDDPEVVAFINRPKPGSRLSNGALADVLVSKGLLTPEEVVPKIDQG